MDHQLWSLPAEMETLRQVLSLVEVFRAFDADNDGLIGTAELGGIMGSLGYNPSQQEVKAMMQQWDGDGDGRLSVEEFLDMNTSQLQALEAGGLATCLRRACEGLAMEGGEVVTAEELCQVMGSIGVELPLQDCQDIIACMDVDEDGAVSFEDFKLIVNSLI